MEIIKNVTGSKEQAKPLIIGYDTVYVHSNIKKLEIDFEDNLYEYDEIQYTKDEYIKIMIDNQIANEQLVTDLELNQLQTEQALTEMELKILELEGVK